MKAFRVTGEFLMAQRRQKFTKEVAAKDEGEAVERVLSLLGSKHRVKRRKIRIHNVSEVAPEEIIDPVVSYMLKVG
ncbi:MAG: 50S ribosomal protein L18a [Candidatus Thermoplasmatota archaeon]|nr:50S ribosomal protein L18a [Candidatus Thermoplasmatota archaeon]